MSAKPTKRNTAANPNEQYQLDEVLKNYKFVIDEESEDSQRNSTDKADDEPSTLEDMSVDEDDGSSLKEFIVDSDEESDDPMDSTDPEFSEMTTSKKVNGRQKNTSGTTRRTTVPKTSIDAKNMVPGTRKKESSEDEIDLSNIVTGKRQRKAPKRFVPAGMSRTYLANINIDDYIATAEEDLKRAVEIENKQFEEDAEYSCSEEEDIDEDIESSESSDAATDSDYSD